MPDSNDTTRVAEALDEVRWEYDAEAEDPSPLVSTRRYFEAFPWEPEELPTTRRQPSRD